MVYRSVESYSLSFEETINIFIGGWALGDISIVNVYFGGVWFVVCIFVNSF